MAQMTYKKAGVNIDAADRFIERIKPLIERTKRPEVLGGIGGFGGLFRPQLKNMEDPVLVSSTDGVGTKLLVAGIRGRYDTVGIDLVAMCVNDIVVCGAEPLFFLDYIAVGRLDENKLYEIMTGIAEGCRQANCALIGGETAELPDMYEGGDFDLAGFCVGLVDGKHMVDGRRVEPGDRIIGLASNGLHSNGFSLVRKIYSKKELQGEAGREIIKPTRIYVRPLLDAMGKIEIKAAAHITGGGFLDNIPRVLPEGCSARIHKGTWAVPAVFRDIQVRGEMEDAEIYRTLNMGIGMAVVCSKDIAEDAVSLFRRLGENVALIGEVIEGSGEVEIV
ncbi:MAG: phosphoribosylformylglycinamidine cyclo-ligase [Candidatus Aminicenantes bacterium]|nr:phosphoribosylformylglycinamidine cyclo-ligase [Candidatus Aminicenantes bacterium]